MALEARRPTFVRYWLPVLAYVSLIFYLSAQPGLRPPLHFQMADKVAHMCEYGVLSLLLGRAIRTTRRFEGLLAAGLMAVVIGAGIGASDELFQSTVPNRDSSVYDWMADTMGLSIAQVVYAWVKRP